MLGVVTIPNGTVTELGIRGTAPQYTATGHLLYATSDGWIFAAPFDAAARRITGTPFPIVEGVRLGTQGAAAFSVARNGTLVYRTGGVSGRGTNELVVVGRNGTERSLGVPPSRYFAPRKRLAELDARGAIVRARRSPADRDAFPIGPKSRGALKRFLAERD